jgi:hypothetical protein
MLIELALEEQAHRVAYTALLRSVLKEPGSKERLARAAGISQQYLSYLLNPADGRTLTFRIPSPRVANQIAGALPADRALREDVRQHMHLASQRQLSRVRAMPAQLSGGELQAQVDELGAAHHHATFLAGPGEARAGYRAVRDVTRDLLEAIRPERNAMSFVELCFLLHDVQCVLDRPGDAVYAARRARFVVGAMRERDVSREYLLQRRMQAIRAEAVAYHNLGLDRMAYERCAEAEDLARAEHEEPDELLHVYRDQLSALAGTSRFALGEVAYLAGRVRRLAERRSDQLDPLWSLLTRRSEAVAYLRHGKVQQAGKLVEELLDQAPHVPMMGPLHHAVLLRAAASVWWAMGDTSRWEMTARALVVLAGTAGLGHQIWAMRQEFGEPADTLVQAVLGHLPTGVDIA